MENVYKLARGTVRIAVEGAEPERLLNYCSEQGIEFWDTSPRYELCLEMSVNARDYGVIADQNGRNGLNIKLISARGGKNITRKMKRRMGFVAGFVVCVVLLSLSSLFVWNIEIKGNETLSSAEIERLLSDCGVEYGTFRLSVSSEEVRNAMLIAEPRIAWMSVNIHNSKAEVIIHERIEKPEIIDESDTSDIVAAKDGIIEKVTVLSGEAVKKKGDTATKGEVLISGTMTSATAPDREVYALGSVTARTWYGITAQKPLYESKKIDTGGKKRGISLVIGKKRIKIFGYGRNHGTECDKITKLGMLSVDNVFTVPVGILTEQWTEYNTAQYRIDEAAAILEMKSELSAELNRRCNGEIVSCEFTVSKDDKMLSVTLHAECLENIGENHDRENDGS